MMAALFCVMMVVLFCVYAIMVAGSRADDEAGRDDE